MYVITRKSIFDIEDLQQHGRNLHVTSSTLHWR